MKNKLLSLFAVLLLAICFIQFNSISTLAADEKEIIWNQEIDSTGYKAISDTAVGAFEFWHYSGGYWKAGDWITLYDKDVMDAIRYLGYIPYDKTIEIKNQLPEEVIEYLNNVGSINDVEIKIEFTGKLDVQAAFPESSFYSIDNNNLTIKVKPKFYVDDNLSVNPTTAVTIPVVPEEYGYMSFSMFTKSGQHLGALPVKSQEVLDGLVVDNQGNIKPGSYHVYDANGNYKTHKGNNIRVGDGTFNHGGAVGLVYEYPIQVTYYIPEETVSVPDFHVTANSAIYEGEPGEEIYAWVTVHNIGEAEGATDLGANWQGEGSNWTTTHHYRSVNEVGVIPAQGTSQVMGVPIIIPETEKTMWFKVNVDGKTPEDEINQSNNLTSAIVRPKPKGVDLKITGEVPMPVMTLYGQDKMKTCVDFVVTRKDGGTEPITAELTMWGPAGTKKETIIIGESEVVKTYWYETNQAGTYNFSAEVWPTALTELYPPDNVTKIYTIQYIRPELDKDKGTTSPIWSELTG